MAHLSLVGSQLHVGTQFDDVASVRQVFDDPSARPLLLFPDDGAMYPDELVERPTHLFIVDGTWSTATKIVRRSRWLNALPKLRLRPPEPGRYRIRREMSDVGMATVEATARALEALSGRPGAFDALLAPFELMVESQLAHRRRGEGRLRHGRKDVSAPRRRLGDFIARGGVIVQAQASVTNGERELVHLVAFRPSTRSWFERVVRPVRPLAPKTARQTGLDAGAFTSGHPIDEVRRAWGEFCGNAPLLTWGQATFELLRAKGLAVGDVLDLRSLVGNILGQSSGGAEKAHRTLRAPFVQAPFETTASRLVAWCAGIAEALGADASNAGASKEESPSV